MFRRKQRNVPQPKRQSNSTLGPKAPETGRPKLSLLALEPRLMFDAAAAATASEVNQERIAQEQAESVASGDNASSSESQELLQAIASYLPGDIPSEIAFVDPTVPDYQSLIVGMGPNVQIVMLDGSQDGMEQIAASLSGRTGIDAIHIISHGAEGQLSLGTATLSQESMTGQYADELATIKQTLSEQADILLYGCDFAKGQAGQDAAAVFSQLTGADVAASADDTGYAGLGGDWDLEFQTGTIETQVAINYDTQADWGGILAVNVAPISTGGAVTGTEDTAYVFTWASFNVSDVDTAMTADSAIVLATRPTEGIIQYNNGSTWVSAAINQVFTKATIDAGLLRFLPDVNEFGSDESGSPGVGNGLQTYAQFNFIPVQSTAHTIANPGGESQVMAEFTWNTRATGWTVTGTAGTFNPTAVQFPIDHDNMFYANAGGTLKQMLGSTFDASQNYTLSFEAGWRLDLVDTPTFRIELWAGGTRVGVVDQSTVTLIKGTFVQGVLTVDGTNFNAQNGQALEIRLIGGTSQTNFDNLVLTSVSRATGLGTVATMSVDISPVNDAPVLADTTLSLTVGEDAGAPSGAVGSLISAFTGGISDVDASASKGIAITGTDETNGRWYYTTNGGTTWTAVGTVSNSSALLLADNGSTRLYFSPAAEYNGTSSAALTVRAWDQTSGAAESKMSTASNGGATAFSSATDTIDVSVTAVNDAPVLALPGALSVAEDQPLTISGVSVSDVDGNLSTVQVTVGNGTLAVTLSGTASISAGASGSNTLTLSGMQADINAALATLTYQSSPNFNGSDILTITSTDTNSGTDVDTVAITVTAVNDPTVVTGGMSGTGNEDTTLTGTLTAIDADGLADGTIFTVSTNATNGTASIDPVTGLWSYTPSADFTGSDSFTVTITDDAGNSSIQVISVTVASVNDAPILLTNTGSTVAEGGTDAITGSELAVTDIEQTAAQLTYTIGTGPVSGRLELSTAPGITATTFTQADIAAGRLIYIHNGSETTSDSFTFTVNDGAGGALGATTITMTITPVNDTPTITSNGGGSTASITVLENVGTVTIVTGVDVDLPTQVLTYSISGGVDQALFTIDTATGALSFTAPPDFEVATDANGDNVYVVQVQVVDSQGESTTQTIQVTVTDMAEGMSITPTSPTVPPILIAPLPSPGTGRGMPGPETPSPSGLVMSVGTGSSPVPGSPEPIGSVRFIVQGPGTEVLPPDLPVVRIPDEVKFSQPEQKPDKPIFLVADDQGQPLLCELSVEWTLPTGPEPPEATLPVRDKFLIRRDEMMGEVEDRSGILNRQSTRVMQIMAVAGSTLSMGFIIWVIRSGALLASLRAIMRVVKLRPKE